MGDTKNLQMAERDLVERMSDLDLDSRAGRLPPELVAIVLAQFDGCRAKEDVLSCSRINREWYSMSRQFAFEELNYTVRDPQTLEALTRTCEVSGRSGRQGALTELLEFLEASPHICPHVRTLRLSAPAEFRQPELVDYPDVDPATLCHILRKLPLLEQLDLCDVIFPPELYAAWRDTELDYPGNLKHLAVTFGSRAGDIDSFDDALHLLEVFSGDIEELCLCTIYAVRLRKPNTQSLRRLRIQSLVIDEVTDIGPLVQAVSMSPSVWSKTLRSVYLSWINMKDLRSAESLLEGVKDTLVSFGCNLFPLLDSKPADEELFQILNFSEMHELKSVTLGLVLLPDAAWNANIWRDVCRILSSLPLSRASQLEINLELCVDRLNYSTHIALPSNWQSLDSTMIGRCKTLKLTPARKTFSIPTEESFTSTLREHISEMLPELTKAKVLVF